MHPIGRAVLAALAVLMVWSLVRALRSGKIFSEMRAYSIDEQPFLFSLTAGAHFLGIAYFAWLAAGGDAATFYHWVLPR
jgi:hypothetical protein